MSRFLTQKDDGSYLEQIESDYECKWRINDMCCNDSSEFLGDYYCKAELERTCFEKEDGIVENGGKPFRLDTYYKGSD